MTDDRTLTVRPDATLTSGQILAGLRTVASVLAPDLTAEELQLFSMVSARSGLDPFAKQIYAVKRKGRVTFQTGIDGYRSIAARTGLYDGQDEPEFGPVCACGDDRPAGHPEYAVVRVYRKGVTRAIAARADWHEYKPEKGPEGKQDLMWVKMPRVMLAKVAEALALRKAFPYDPEHRQGIGADIYTADEMAQADRQERPRPAPAPTLAETARARAEVTQHTHRPIVSDACAECTRLARPGDAVQDATQAPEPVVVVSEPTPEPVEAAQGALCGRTSDPGLGEVETCIRVPHTTGACESFGGSRFPGVAS